MGAGPPPYKVLQGAHHGGAEGGRRPHVVRLDGRNVIVPSDTAVHGRLLEALRSVLPAGRT